MINKLKKLISFTLPFLPHRIAVPGGGDTRASSVFKPKNGFSKRVRIKKSVFVFFIVLPNQAYFFG